MLDKNAYPSYGKKKWSKINATIKNAKILASFMQDNCPKEKYLTSSAKIS